MISIKQVVDQLEAFAIAHKQIKKFGFEFKEQMQNLATENEKYPFLFVCPIDSDPMTNTVGFAFDIYCVDRIQNDRSNTKFIVSDTQLILGDLSRWLEEGDHSIDVDRVYPSTPINNDLLDYVQGWVMRVRVQVERIGLCEIPMDGIEPFSTECDGVDIYRNGVFVQTVSSGDEYDFIVDPLPYEITNTDGDILYSGTIPDQGSLTQSIQDSTVSNSNNSYGATVLAEGSLELPDEALDVYVNGILNQSLTYIPLSGEVINISA